MASLRKPLLSSIQATSLLEMIYAQWSRGGTFALLSSITGSVEVKEFKSFVPTCGGYQPKLQCRQQG